MHTEFHWNRMILGWDIAIKPFSKWWPSAILNFRNLIFWSWYLCLNVIMLLRTKFRVNRTINYRDIAKNDFNMADWRPSAILDLLHALYTHVLLMFVAVRLSREHDRRHTRHGGQHRQILCQGWHLSESWKPHLYSDCRRRSRVQQVQHGSGQLSLQYVDVWD